MTRPFNKFTVLSFVLAVLYFGSGASKLAGAEMQVQSFLRWNYPMWFLYLTGLLEVLGAGLLLAQSTRLVGTVVLGCVMLGAIVTHVAFGEFGMALAPVVLLLLLGWIGAAAKRPVLEGPSTAEYGRQAEHHRGSV